jgi:hypothetical protein
MGPRWSGQHWEAASEVEPERKRNRFPYCGQIYRADLYHYHGARLSLRMK